MISYEKGFDITVKSLSFSFAPSLASTSMKESNPNQNLFTQTIDKNQNSTDRIKTFFTFY